ncbi:ATP-dependent protease La [Gemmatirosa kalamazoonensis]|uniref:Lon protease n=1 Tax=Gemmatirosa kalamazoonensis TaxID=861299 RepID=W0RJX0_9BACT|nr:endopeptidase La [Gemmatirosa kalamazoonensis]AHG91394.1 ATP-dependent protease La [Gemmatirosa kalamazoonensis]
MKSFPRDGDPIEAPSRLPVLPLRDAVLFPYVVTPVVVGRPASLAAVEAAAAGDGLLFVVAQKDTAVDDPAPADLHRVGVLARIQQAARLQNGAVRVLLEGAARARVTRYETRSTAPKGAPPNASPNAPLRATLAPFPLVEPQPDEPPATTAAGTPELQAAMRRILDRFEDYAALQRRVPVEIVTLLRDVTSVERQAFGVAAHLAVRHEQRQRLLEAPALPDMLARLDELLGGELELLGLERQIEERVRGAVFQNQREFYLHEQLKAIHQELGHDESDDTAALEAQVRDRGMPPSVESRALREVRRLRKMSPVSPEATVSRTFLDWLLGLPWRERSAAPPDVAGARAVLDEDHHGLEEVKDRILDHIAVLALVGELRGPVLCLVGPPGVGKTSLARSIARALGRKFVRVSLGGVRDEAEIRGHRRTYVGAMPGRIVQAMRRAEVVDPVLLLDEIDKTGSDWRGDPAAALLEVLDPEQHHAFSDHFLEVDYDLSRVLFVTTANSLAGIPEPLRDRMELIRIPGYLEPEKLAIARRFLVPRALSACGLDADRVTWDDEALLRVIREWTREAGVRDLERRIHRVARKLARRQAERGAESVERGDDESEPPRSTLHAPRSLDVRAEDLPDLLGPPPHEGDELTSDDKIGVANGLAYTPAGGELLEVEVSVVPGRGRLQLTGALGDVMKESASAALSYVRARAAALGIDPDFHRARDIHVHIPAGATPKDGPSAGITIATAMVSALTGNPVRGDVAMTGEITLRGRVLAVGGVKEKAVAAHRHRVHTVILPKRNARDAAELPADVREAIAWHPVSSMDEVLTVALRVPAEASR